MSAPAALGAGELLDLYRRRALSPVEATRASLAAIEAEDPRVRAFCLVDPDEALAAARASEARWTAGEPRGLLDGVPVGVKDVFLTAGWPTLRGFPVAGADATWEADAPAVAALRRHGAVMVGKTTTPQIGWKAVTDGPEVPTTRNPWDPARTAGGSSGGSAAAVASGMVPLALGTDGAGSIRIPGSFCGIVGLKPTWARVPQWPPSPFGLLAHAGPMARTVDDAALLLDALVAPDARDWAGLPPASGSYRAAAAEDLGPVRVAFSPDLGHAPVDPEVAEAVAAGVAALEGLGARVERVEVGWGDPRPALDTLWESGAAFAVRALAAEQRERLDEGLAEVAERGARRSALDVVAAEARRAELGAATGALHADWDLLVTPTMPVPAFGADRLVPQGWPDPWWPSWTPFTYPFNLTQQPALTVPCGFTANGLPVGLQVVGPRHAEGLVLRAGAALERALPQPTLAPGGGAG